MPESIAYVGGRFVPVSQAALHVFDLGVVSGASATEMVRTFAHRPFRLEDHLERLMESARGLYIVPPLSRDELSDVTRRVVEHNAPLVPASHDLGITIFITAGRNAIYLSAEDRRRANPPTVCVHTFPLPFELWADKLEFGQHLVTPDVRQIPAESIDPRIKCRSRVHWRIADHQARSIASDATAVLLDRDGFLTETATANLFVVQGGRIMTPPATKTLEGISQKMVRELAEELGIPYEVRDLRPDDLAAADEAFTSSTPSCLLPCTRFQQRAIGDGRPGPVFRRLLEAWSRAVGVEIVRQTREARSG